MATEKIVVGDKKIQKNMFSSQRLSLKKRFPPFSSRKKSVITGFYFFGATEKITAGYFCERQAELTPKMLLYRTTSP